MSPNKQNTEINAPYFSTKYTENASTKMYSAHTSLGIKFHFSGIFVVWIYFGSRLEFFFFGLKTNTNPKKEKGFKRETGLCLFSRFDQLKVTKQAMQ